MVDSGTIARAIGSGAHDALEAVFAALPQTGMSPASRQLGLSHRVESRLIAFDIVSQQLAYGVAPAAGAAVAGAVLQVALEHLDDPEFIKGSAARIAASAAAKLAEAMTHDGRHREIVGLAERIVGLLGGRTDIASIGSLGLKSAAALIDSGELEAAERGLQALADAGYSDPNLGLVRQRLEARLIDARTPARKTSLAGDYRQSLQTSVEALRALATKMDPSFASAFDALAQQAKTEAIPEDPAAIFERANRMIGNLSSLVGGGSELLARRGRLREASATFVDKVAGRDPERLAKSLAEAGEARAWFDAHEQRDDANSARWVEFLALRRLGRLKEALTMLEQLAARLEQDRAKVVDPVRRAGILRGFPMLAMAATEVAGECKEPRRMLAAIEAAKGRMLGDLLTRRDGVAADESALHGNAADAASLTQQLGVHYLSFLVGEDATYAVLVTRQRQWHWRQLDFDQPRLARLSRRLQPEAWKPVPGQPAFDLGAAMAPLVDWLRPLLDGGVLHPGEHLVYSPDEHLHQLPLHLASLGGVPIGTVLAMSRVHGLATLQRMLRRPPVRPRQALALFVPTRDEADLDRKQATARATLAPLGKPYPIAWPKPASIDRDYIGRLAAPATLVHVVAHGVFPEETITAGIDPNPYVSAGLLIADGGAIPQRSGAWTARLTPKLVVESAGLDLTDGFVALQGCVSGLSKEGVGGDALGLEWALLVKGAASVLATHWNVNYRSAGAFCRHFYAAWIAEGRSRIAAWQAAAAATRGDPEGGATHDWAAFSLTGDWR